MASAPPILRTRRLQRRERFVDPLCAKVDRPTRLLTPADHEKIRSHSMRCYADRRCFPGFLTRLPGSQQGNLLLPLGTQEFINPDAYGPKPMLGWPISPRPFYR